MLYLLSGEIQDGSLPGPTWLGQGRVSITKNIMACAASKTHCLANAHTRTGRGGWTLDTFWHLISMKNSMSAALQHLNGKYGDEDRFVIFQIAALTPETRLETGAAMTPFMS